MRVFGFWNAGDGSYAFRGDMSTDGETWESIREAKDVFRERFESGGWWRDRVTRVVDIDDDGYARPGEPVDVLFPAVSEDCSMELYSGVRSGEGGRGRRWLIDDEPFARLVFGPRGGVVVERF